MVRAPLFFIKTWVIFLLLVIVLLYLVILGMSAQSIIADRNTWRSNNLDEYKGVRQ